MHSFDEVIDRTGTNSMKWAGGKGRLTPAQQAANPLPMWIADMDFRVPQPIRAALAKEVEFGVFGYTQVSDGYIEAVLEWQARRFGWSPQPEWLVPTVGVVNALNMAIQAFSEPGDYVIVQPPVYIHFHHDVLINGRRLIEVPLTVSADGYRFDPVKFEAAIRPGTKLFILCNPHNPTGNVWTREELCQMGEICRRHNILIVSDEIHQDFVFDRDKKHIPFASLSPEFADNCIACTSPSKTFNIAGLQCANIFIPNERLRMEFLAQAERCGVKLLNNLGPVACEAAYRHCAPWVDAMLDYVAANQRHFSARLGDLGLPLRVMPTGSLYLAWIDCRALALSASDLHDQMIRRARLWLDPGSKFGSAGEGFMRINLACPRSTVDEALNRLANASF